MNRLIGVDTQPSFTSLVEDQFRYGGKKYRNSDEKEVTDILCENFGTNGLLWTIGKYTWRFRNQGLEKDLLKIGCYMFILWLKRGFHIDPLGTDEIINTTVEVKEKYFSDFLQGVKKYDFLLVESDMDDVFPVLVEMGQIPFYNIDSLDLYIIWNIVETIWNEKFAKAETHLTDTK